MGPEIFIGLSLAGTWLTLKVVQEGLKRIEEENNKIEAYRVTAATCRDQMVDHEKRVVELEEEMSTIREGLEAIQAKEKELSRQIRVAESELEGPKFKIDT